MVYNHKRGPVGPLDHNVYIGPEFGVPYAKQMVSHSPRNLQRGHVLVPRVVQNRLSGLQCRSLRGSADRRIKKEASNKALHLTAIPLRSIPAGEGHVSRYNIKEVKMYISHWAIGS